MKIINNKPEEICKDHYLIRIDAQDADSGPGQFLNIKIGNETDPLLRRPFSIHNHENNVMEIIVRAIGKGTRYLSGNVIPENIDILGPLGNCFSNNNKKKVLLLGGGVGNAPLYYLARHLKEQNNHVTYLYGARSADFIFLKDKYKSIADYFMITTDDGSEGEKGIITDIAREIISNISFDYIYACGPGIMLKLLTEIAIKNSIPVEVSIETYFGCGFGVCYGCTVETSQGLLRACKEGPVFDGEIINWDKFNH